MPAYTKVIGGISMGIFCNWTGRKTRNIGDDLAQEIYNNVGTNAVKYLEGNNQYKQLIKYAELQVE